MPYSKTALASMMLCLGGCLVDAAPDDGASEPSDITSDALEPRSQILVAGAGPSGGPHVVVYDAHDGTMKRSFFAYASTFRGGVQVAVGDFDGDGVDDVITVPGPTGGPHLRVFSGVHGGVLWE